MRVLLDEPVPRPLAPLLLGHWVFTVEREGWAGMTNGELLRHAAERFDALVTGDQDLQFQQQLSGRDLGVLVLVTQDNRVETISALHPRNLAALGRLQPGQLIRVES